MSCVGCIYTIKTRKDAECTCPMTYACNTSEDKPISKEEMKQIKKERALHSS